MFPVCRGEVLKDTECFPATYGPQWRRPLHALPYDPVVNIAATVQKLVGAGRTELISTTLKIRWWAPTLAAAERALYERSYQLDGDQRHGH